MRFIVEKNELIKKISDIQSITSKKTTLPIIGYFLLNIGEENYLIATDLDTAIKQPLHIKETTGQGSLCLPSKKFYEIVRELDGDISIETEDQWITISSGRSNFRLSTVPAEDFPAWPEIKETLQIEMSSDVLSDMINRTVYAAGEGETRYTLNSLLFHIIPEGRLKVVGTDGHRLALVETEAPSVEEEIKAIVPRRSAIELRKFLIPEEKVNIRFSSNHVLFMINGINFLTRLIEGKYPNYEDVIPRDNDKKAVIPREDFLKVLKRVSIMSREKNNAVLLTFKKSLLTAHASSPDIGEAKEELQIQYTGSDISVGFNARYLIEPLTVMNAERVVLEIKEPLTATLLKGDGEENYLCVIMPMRI